MDRPSLRAARLAKHARPASRVQHARATARRRLQCLGDRAVPHTTLCERKCASLVRHLSCACALLTDWLMHADLRMKELKYTSWKTPGTGSKEANWDQFTWTLFEPYYHCDFEER